MAFIVKIIIIVVAILYGVIITFYFLNKKGLSDGQHDNAVLPVGITDEGDTTEDTKGLVKRQNAYEMFKGELNKPDLPSEKRTSETLPTVSVQTPKDKQSIFDDEFHESFPIDEEYDRQVPLSEFEDKNISIDGVSIAELEAQEREARLIEYYNSKHEISLAQQNAFSDSERQKDWENAERHYNSLPEIEDDETASHCGISVAQIAMLSHCLEGDFVAPTDELEKVKLTNNLRRVFTNLSETELFNQMKVSEVLAEANEPLRSIIEIYL